MQADVGEAECISRLSEALKNAKPVKVAITNKKKDGKVFQNLLAIKPLFDQNGLYSYIVGVQFDIGSSDATPARLLLVNELMKTIPDIIFDDRDFGAASTISS